ncbi:MAG: uroporphyrinogen-III C-methyltransferase [Armatimonadota bacterium]
MSKVYLVGAGPGDPGLLTVKGLECVRKADVIVYDRLAHPSILAEARPDTEMIYVGKVSSAHTMKQADINRLLVDKAKEGKIVVRLKGGDPFIFGRGGEEAELLVEEGISFEVVPGISSAIAVPAYAGIPVTHRGLCCSLGIITGHEDPTKEISCIQWDKISTGLDTIVFLMGVENLPNIVSHLTSNGRDLSTPIALVRWGTRSEQETLTGTLEDIVGMVESTGFKSPAVIVVGEVVRLREKLRWFDNRPLTGKKVIVTRSREQMSSLSTLLLEQGAETIEFPVITIAPPDDFVILDAALSHMEDYDWLLLTSANGVTAVIDRLHVLGWDSRWLKGPKIGAIGPKTAESIKDLGITVSYMPSESVAEAVVDQFPEDPTGKRILILNAKDARDVLPKKLQERGAEVESITVYQTVIENSDSSGIKDLMEKGDIDYITFTSSSTVSNFVRLIGKDTIALMLDKTKVVCIGPITSQTAVELGLNPDIVAEDHTIEGIIDALVTYAAHTDIDGDSK